MTYPYEAKDWLADWEAILESSPITSAPERSRYLKERFLKRYPDVKEAQWRCNRGLAAFEYMKANAPEFEKAGYLLSSSKSGEVGFELSRILCGFFGQVEDETLANTPSPDAFIWALNEFERMRKSGQLP
jgi:hypothetical protein